MIQIADRPSMLFPVHGALNYFDYVWQQGYLVDDIIPHPIVGQMHRLFFSLEYSGRIFHTASS